MENNSWQNQQELQVILDSAPIGFSWSDLQGNIKYVNSKFQELFGYSAEDIPTIDRWLLQAYPSLSHREQVIYLSALHIEAKMQGKEDSPIEVNVTCKDGSIRQVLQTVVITSNRILAIYYDITERKQAKKALQESEQKYKSLIENIPDIIFTIDLEGKITFASKKAKEILGYEEEAINTFFFDYIPEEDRHKALEDMHKGAKGERMKHIETPIIAKSGEKLFFDCSFTRIYKDGAVIGAQGTAVDITERKKAEDELKQSEAKYRNIFENAVEGIYQSTIEGRFITANASFARMAGYDSPEELIESIKDIGTQLYVHPEDRKRFLEIREAKSFVDGFEVEFYKKDRSKFWVVINARMVKDEQGRILYNEGLIEDITIRKHAEEQLHQTLESLRKAVGATIQVLVSAVESRDPYTSGHQSRTANLACVIATEMGLAQDKIEGLRMAGIIHDIGKLAIPAELLAKPTKLTDLEFSLIKEHSRSGYEMLKNVESSWPLAQIVYQHHERMNGSGYPRNLKGDDILIEARIMAVADVVEAMASHRPYRPTLGIKAALEEIEKNKGILYDNVVANTCLKLFREKGYRLK